LAIELAHGGESDVIEVEVEAHADRVGGDEVLDFARFVEGHLRVAGARRKGTENDGGAPSSMFEPRGDRVDLVGAECDDGAAGRKATEAARAGPAQGAQARPP